MNGVVAGMDWQQLFAFSGKQALTGVCFDGIERLGREYPAAMKENPISPDLLLAWMGKAQQIRRQNMKVNVTAAKLYEQLRGEGLQCSVLKGQGNALMYSNPYSRMPGDIDVWVNAGRERIEAFAKEHYGWKDEKRYHHLETTLDGVPIELHFMPCTMNNPVYNRRLQRWFGRVGDLQCSNVVSLPDGAGDVAVPTAAFNVVYQLCHLYHHFFDDGIGMRQMMDYAILLKSLPQNPQRTQNASLGLNTETTEASFLTTNLTNLTNKAYARRSGENASLGLNTETAEAPFLTTNQTNLTNKAYARRSGENLCESVGSVGDLTTNLTTKTNVDVLQCELKRLGLWKFAGAVMWVLHETLGLPEDKMIAPMDEKRGRLLLGEILDGGNFGKHAARYGHFTQQGVGKKYFLKIWRSMHFVRCYPAEALSEPVFRTWHFFWRASH